MNLSKRGKKWSRERSRERSRGGARARARARRRRGSHYSKKYWLS
jgi:hypothetical protein